MALNHGYIESALSFKQQRHPPLMEYKWNMRHCCFYKTMYQHNGSCLLPGFLEFWHGLRVWVSVFLNKANLFILYGAMLRPTI